MERTIEAELAHCFTSDEHFLEDLIERATGEYPSTGQAFSRSGLMWHFAAVQGDSLDEDVPDFERTGSTVRLALIALCEAIGLTEEENDDGRHPLTAKGAEVLDNANEAAWVRANEKAVA